MPLAPPNIALVIETMLHHGWGSESPRSYQINAIFQLVVQGGKPLILIGTVALLCGVTDWLVPLLRLASDQAMKSNNLRIGVKPYDADEFKGDNSTSLRTAFFH